MKKPIVTFAALLACVPYAALACGPGDFEITNFNPSLHDPCRRSSCIQIRLPAKLTNNCKSSAGAEVVITALDKSGNMVNVQTGWPASISNIAPGDTLDFDFGPMFRYTPDMASFTIRIKSARTW